MIVVYGILSILIGLLVGALSGLLDGPPPHGAAADLGATLLATVAVGLLDYDILPLLGYRGTLRFVAKLVEPPIGAAIAIWLLRRITRWKGAQSP